MTYQLTTEGYVIRLSDGAKIATTDPENTNEDYIAYREWLDGGGVPEPADLESLKAEKRSALAEEYQSRIQSFPWDFGAPFGVLHLQLRDVTDQANWLTLQGKAMLAISAGQGDSALLPIRTEENVTVPVTANVAAQVMDALSTFGGTMLAHRWSLQDAITAAEDEASLDAIDITSGWPS